MKLTVKQHMIMKTAMTGHRNKDGFVTSWLDIDELLERLPYRTTKQGIQFSLRYLGNKGMVENDQKEKRRGRRRRLVVPTNFAFDLLHKRPNLRDIGNENYAEWVV